MQQRPAMAELPARRATSSSAPPSQTVNSRRLPTITNKRPLASASHAEARASPDRSGERSGRVRMDRNGYLEQRGSSSRRGKGLADGYRDLGFAATCNCVARPDLVGEVF